MTILTENKTKENIFMNKLSAKSARVKKLTFSALICALYVAFIFLSMSLGLDKGAIQVRFSEALIVLAYITPVAIPGLTLGCLLSNLLTGCALLDIVLGPVATLAGAVGAYLFGRMKKEGISKFLCTLPNVLVNAFVVGYICKIYYSYGEQGGRVFWFYFCTVGIGEIISSAVLGTALLLALEKAVRRFLK